MPSAFEKLVKDNPKVVQQPKEFGKDLKSQSERNAEKRQDAFKHGRKGAHDGKDHRNAGHRRQGAPGQPKRGGATRFGPGDIMEQGEPSKEQRDRKKQFPEKPEPPLPNQEFWEDYVRNSEAASLETQHNGRKEVAVPDSMKDVEKVKKPQIQLTNARDALVVGKKKSNKKAGAKKSAKKKQVKKSLDELLVEEGFNINNMPPEPKPVRRRGGRGGRGRGNRRGGRGGRGRGNRRGGRGGRGRGNRSRGRGRRNGNNAGAE